MYELKQGLELRQTLTPQQILLSTLLQLPSLALEQRISTELELNPVLELIEDTEDVPPEEEKTDEEKTEEQKEEDKTDEERMDEIDLDDYFGNDGYEARQQKDNSKEEYTFQNPYKPTLAELLLDQIKELNLTDLEEQIMEDLIWSVDEGGYLIVPLDYVADKFEIDIAIVERVHAQLMTLNPIGIGARNLQECLLIQVEKYHPDTVAYYIIRDHFVDFANKRYERILRALSIDKEELHRAEETISRFNPKPGDGTVSMVNSYITPDFYIREEDGEFLVTLNDAFIPDLRISGRYLEMIKNQKKLDTESKSYLKKKLESAKWFVNSIQMRRITMMKVIHAVITRQKEFFLYGQEHLKPMVLRDIAEDISMDISTISRVTSGKYAQTDWGVYDLRYFFSEGIEAEDGENISTRRIKDRLKVIIGKEDKNKPISDEALSKILQKEGFPIARRTVAKYREQLKLPVARLRREI